VVGALSSLDCDGDRRGKDTWQALPEELLETDNNGDKEQQ